jgi:hypothetical protein
MHLSISSCCFVLLLLIHGVKVFTVLMGTDNIIVNIIKGER